MHVYGIIEIEPDGRPGAFIKIGKGPADRRVLNHQTGNPRRLCIAFWALYRSDKMAEKVEREVLAATRSYSTYASNEWRRLDGNVLAALDALQSHPETVEIKWEIPLLDEGKLALAAELRQLKSMPPEDPEYEKDWDAWRKCLKSKDALELHNLKYKYAEGLKQRDARGSIPILERDVSHIVERAASHIVNVTREQLDKLTGRASAKHAHEDSRNNIEQSDGERTLAVIEAAIKCRERYDEAHEAERKWLLARTSDRRERRAARISEITALLAK